MNRFKSLFWSVCMCLLFLGLFESCQPSHDETRLYGWFDFVIPDLDTTANVVDMSFLNNEDAGSAGYITVKDGHFADGNGEKIRFFGTNLTFSSCFPDKETATGVAGRLRKLGMNVVRFHHMDMRSAPAGIWNETMQDLDSGQLEKLDWLIYQLREHGIYSNLNTHVSFTYPGVDYPAGIEAFNFGKTIDHFYRPYIEMQKVYARKLLTHRNPFTGKAYTDEPAVAFIEINNENSLLSSWYLLPQLNNLHKAALIRQWKTWLSAKPDYPKNADLMAIIQNYEKQPDLPKEMMWSFLIDTELAYTKEMVDFLKNDLKVHALISESQASYSGAAGVLREATYADFIDMHAYWEHPSFPNRSWSRTDWLIRNSSMVADKKGGTLIRFGEHRVAGMPITISEYDHPAPTFFCAEMYPLLNSVASFQDFDGIYHFTFNGVYREGKIPNFFSSAGHPLKQVFVPAGAVLFRMGAVHPGKEAIQLQMPENTVLEQMVKHGSPIRLHRSNMNLVWEKKGALPSMIVQHPMSVSLAGDELMLTGPAPAQEGPWQSETGEITWDNRDSVNAVFTVNTALAKAAVGYIGGKEIILDEVTIQMDTTPWNWAAITLTALDGKSLAESKRILLVAAGRVENTDMGWNETKTSVGDQWGKSPTRAEGIPAKLALREMEKFKVHALDSAGNPVSEVKIYRKGGEQSFSIGAQYKTLWYALTRE